MSATKLKASERQTILLKLVTALKKKYGKSPSADPRPVFDTLLFAACLEDAQLEQAEQAFQELKAAFYDLNEIRVSSISEIERALARLPEAEWKALRIRDALQTVFEAHYKFDLEHLKRKTHEQALKELGNLRYSTPFMRTYVVQQCLGGHVLPLDSGSRSVLIWLGLIEPSTTLEAAAEDLKSSVRKSDAMALCHLLHELASDPEFSGCFHLTAQEVKHGIDPRQAAERLTSLLASGGRRKRPVAAAKSTSKVAVRKTLKKPAAKQLAQRPKGASSPAKKVTKKLTKKPAAKRR